jgi:hypothetical protein
MSHKIRALILATVTLAASNGFAQLITPEKAAVLKNYSINTDTKFDVASTYSTPSVEAVAFDGVNLWATVNAASKLLKIDRYGTVLSATSVGNAPITLASDGKYMWVTNFSDGTVTPVALSNGAASSAIALPSGSQPEGIAFDGTNIWVANCDSTTLYGSVVKIDVQTKSIATTYPIGTSSAYACLDGIVYGAGYLWATDFVWGRVWRIDPSNGSKLNIANLTHANGIAFDGTNIWVADETSSSAGQVVKILAASPYTQTPFTLGTGTRGVTYDGESVWVAWGGTASPHISRIRVSDGAKTDFTSPVAIRGVAFDGTHVWGAGSGTPYVVKF